MRFSTLAIPALFSALAAADPETISVTGLVVRNIDSAIESASFTIEPANVACSVSAYDGDVTAVNLCGESKYRFYIEEESLTNYNLTVYKETGLASGVYREEPLVLYCHAGPTGITDYVCDQTSDKVFTLTFDGQ